MPGHGIELDVEGLRKRPYRDMAGKGYRQYWEEFPRKNYVPGATRTVSLAIYDHVQALEYGAANRTALLLVAFSFLVLVLTYGMQRRPWSPVSGR